MSRQVKRVPNACSPANALPIPHTKKTDEKMQVAQRKQQALY